MSEHETNQEHGAEQPAESTQDAPPEAEDEGKKGKKGKRDKNGKVKGRSIPKLVLGLLIIIAGMSMLLDQMNVNADYLWRVLPLMVIFIGVAKVAGASAHSQRFMGGLIIFTGIIWLSGMWNLWPMAVILLGLYVVWRAVGGRTGLPHSGRGVTHSDYIRDFVLFGSSERRIESRNFQGGDLTAVFGGVDLDLRSCPPPEGEAPVLELFVLFGGIDIRVPETWVVSQEASALFGGIEDSTHAPVGGSLDAASPPRLVLKGVALFGGIEIKN